MDGLECEPGFTAPVRVAVLASRPAGRTVHLFGAGKDGQPRQTRPCISREMAAGRHPGRSPPRRATSHPPHDHGSAPAAFCRHRARDLDLRCREFLGCQRMHSSLPVSDRLRPMTTKPQGRFQAWRVGEPIDVAGANDREQDPPRGIHERAAREARCEPDPAGIVALSPRRPLGWAPGLGRIGRRLGAMDHQRPECHGDHPHATATGDIPQRRRARISPSAAVRPFGGFATPCGIARVEDVSPWRAPDPAIH
jgi:hypothetical protein